MIIDLLFSYNTILTLQQLQAFAYITNGVQPVVFRIRQNLLCSSYIGQTCTWL